MSLLRRRRCVVLVDVSKPNKPRNRLLPSHNPLSLLRFSLKSKSRALLEPYVYCDSVSAVFVRIDIIIYTFIRRVPRPRRSLSPKSKPHRVDILFVAPRVSLKHTHTRLLPRLPSHTRLKHQHQHRHR
jgi:hypothetical protein